MSRFTSHLGLTLLEYSNGDPVTRDGRCLWYLSSPLIYERGQVGSGDLFVVPAFNPEGWTDAQLRKIRCPGVTDLASIPSPASALLPPDGPWAKAAVLHDHGYVTKGAGRYTRAEIDGLLMEAMTVLGVPAWKRYVIWSQVRVWGWRGWGT